MHRKPLYTPAKFWIQYDGQLPVPKPYLVKEGDYIVTHTNRAFFVQGVTPSKKIPGRYNCRTLRWSVDEIPPLGKIIYTQAAEAKKKKRLRSKPPLLPFDFGSGVESEPETDGERDQPSDQDAGV